ETIRENLASLQLERRATVIKGPVLLALARSPADIVFLDPPYILEREYLAALELLSQAPPALIVLQHAIRLKLADSFGSLGLSRIVKQGDNALSFFGA
ncbi:MAG: RsmD family RNA methyltransferase, partial [Solirubrobacteraceae bacterium]